MSGDVAVKPLANGVEALSGAQSATVSKVDAPPAASPTKTVEFSSSEDAVAFSGGDSGRVSDAKAQPLTREEAERIVRDLEEILKDVSPTALKFEVSQEENDDSAFSFKVIDRETGKVIRQFPPDEALSVLMKLDSKNGAGLILNESV